MNTNAHVDRQNDEHRLLEEDFERHEEDLLGSLANRLLVHLQRCIESIVARYFANLLCLLLQQNGFIRFRQREERHDQSYPREDNQDPKKPPPRHSSDGQPSSNGRSDSGAGERLEIISNDN